MFGNFNNGSGNKGNEMNTKSSLFSFSNSNNNNLWFSGPSIFGGNSKEKESKNQGSLFNNNNISNPLGQTVSTNIFGGIKEETESKDTSGTLFNKTNNSNPFTQTVPSSIFGNNNKKETESNNISSLLFNNNNLFDQKANNVIFNAPPADDKKKKNEFTKTSSLMNNNNNPFVNKQEQNKPTQTLFGQDIKESQNNKPTTNGIFSNEFTNIITTHNNSEEPKAQTQNLFNQVTTTTKAETDENNFIVSSSPFSSLLTQNKTFIETYTNNTFCNNNNTKQTQQKPNSSLPFALQSPFDNAFSNNNTTTQQTKSSLPFDLKSPSDNTFIPEQPSTQTTIEIKTTPSSKPNQINILKDILTKLNSPLSDIINIQQTLLKLTQSIQNTVTSIEEVLKPIETKQFTKTQYYSTFTNRFSSISPKELFDQIQKHSSSIESLLTENYHTQLTKAIHSFIEDINNKEPYTKGLKTLTYLNKQDTYYGDTKITISQEGQQQIFKEGFGVLTFKSGNAFVGEFTQDKQTKGVYVTPSAIIISSNYTTVNINENENNSSKEVTHIAKDSLVIQHTNNIIYIGDFNMDTSTPYETKGHLIKLTSNETKTFLFSSKHTKLYYNVKDNKGYIKITPEEKTSFQTDFETYLIKDIFRSFNNLIVYFALYYLPKDAQHSKTQKPIYIGKLIKKKNSPASHPEFQPHLVNSIHDSNFDEGNYNALIYPNDTIYVGGVSKGNYLIKNGSDCLIYYKDNDMILYNAVIDNNQIKKGKVCKREEFNSIKTLEFEGEFRNSKPVKGVITFKNGSKYEGDVNELFMMHGKGVFYYEGNKMIYEGMFQNGKKHGEGVLKVENEFAHKVKYDKDKLVEQLD